MTDKINYTPEEKKIFDSIIKKNNCIPIFSSAKRDSEITKLRSNMWEKVVDEFNECEDIKNKRTVRQLRRLYFNSKFHIHKSSSSESPVDPTLDKKFEIDATCPRKIDEKPKLLVGSVEGEKSSCLSLKRINEMKEPEVPNNHQNSNGSLELKKGGFTQKDVVLTKSSAEFDVRSIVKNTVEKKSSPSGNIPNIPATSSVKAKMHQPTDGNGYKRHLDDPEFREKQKSLKLDILTFQKQFWETRALREEFELSLAYEESERKRAADARKKK